MKKNVIQSIFALEVRGNVAEESCRQQLFECVENAMENEFMISNYSLYDRSLFGLYLDKTDSDPPRPLSRGY